MKVQDIMTADVETCRLDDTLDRPAAIMWERDCGVVPVVDDESRIVGMLTDRDICMAAYTQGRPLPEIRCRPLVRGHLGLASWTIRSKRRKPSWPRPRCAGSR